MKRSIPIYLVFNSKKQRKKTGHNVFLSFSVLFIADLKIVYDEYKKMMSSTCDNKTIITVNPGILRKY